MALHRPDRRLWHHNRRHRLPPAAHTPQGVLACAAHSATGSPCSTRGAPRPASHSHKADGTVSKSRVLLSCCWQSTGDGLHRTCQAAQAASGRAPGHSPCVAGNAAPYSCCTPSGVLCVTGHGLSCVPPSRRTRIAHIRCTGTNGTSLRALFYVEFITCNKRCILCNCSHTSPGHITRRALALSSLLPSNHHRRTWHLQTAERADKTGRQFLALTSDPPALKGAEPRGEPGCTPRAGTTQAAPPLRFKAHRRINPHQLRLGRWGL